MVVHIFVKAATWTKPKIEGGGAATAIERWETYLTEWEQEDVCGRSSKTMVWRRPVLARATREGVLGGRPGRPTDGGGGG